MYLLSVSLFFGTLIHISCGYLYMGIFTLECFIVSYMIDIM